MASRNKPMAVLIKSVRQYFFQQALIEKMDISQMSGDLLSEVEEEKKKEDATKPEVMQYDADRKNILAGIEVIENVMSTKTEHLFGDMSKVQEAVPFISDPEVTRPLFSFFDHLRRWERFLRARHNWWRSISGEFPMSEEYYAQLQTLWNKDSQLNVDIDKKFAEYFKKFRDFSVQTSDMAIRKGHIEVVCIALDEWAMENMKCTVFTEIVHNKAPLISLFGQLKVIEDDVSDHTKM